MSTKSSLAIKLTDFVGGRLVAPQPWRLRISMSMLLVRLSRFFRGQLSPARNYPPDEGDSLPPGAGRLAPLRPTPGHHLVAARALPPSETTHLLPRD
jgi:hypothetical protein